MEKKAKIGMDAFMILGIVYTALGGIFTVLGVTFILSHNSELAFIGGTFGSVGALFLILGIVFLVMVFRKKKRAEELMAAGRYVWAEVVDCVPNYAVRINGRCPYILKVRYVDSRGMNHIFKSANLRIFRDPGMIGKQVKVYYDTVDFRHYYVDADPILGAYIEH